MSDTKPAKPNKKDIEVEVDGRKLRLTVKRPDQKQQAQGQLVYNRTFRDAVQPEDGGKGAIVRGALERVLREQKIWDDAKQAEYERLQKALREGEVKLTRGGVRLSEGRETAIQMRRDRFQMQALLAERNSLDGITAEAQAENARFNYWVATCTVDPVKGPASPYFKSVEDYNSRADDPVAEKAAQALANLVYSLEDDWSRKLPEEQWLRAYGYARETDGHLVDRATGHLVRSDGRRVNEVGQLLHPETGHPCDEDGNLLGPDGTLLAADQQPFLDDDGNPVSIPEAIAKVPAAKAAEAEATPVEISEKSGEKTTEKGGTAPLNEAALVTG